MQNKLLDLNNHLFAQLERLGDEDLVGDKLSEEINRARAITEVAGQVISNANLVLAAYKVALYSKDLPMKMPLLLTGDNVWSTDTRRKKYSLSKAKSPGAVALK
jgi:hypothetical protein